MHSASPLTTAVPVRVHLVALSSPRFLSRSAQAYGMQPGQPYSPYATSTALVPHAQAAMQLGAPYGQPPLQMPPYYAPPIPQSAPVQTSPAPSTTTPSYSGDTIQLLVDERQYKGEINNKLTTVLAKVDVLADRHAPLTPFWFCY